ncbi:MAG: hypothetical protein AAF351_14050 [Pseudomonadota bacterium]
MSFQEKSAWGLLFGIFLVSFFYFPSAISIVQHSGNPIALIAVSAIGVIALVAIEVIYHVVIVAGGDESDERDKLIELKAERNAGFALGFVLFVLVGHIVLNEVFAAREQLTALLIAVYVIAAITFSEIVKLLSQIGYYRVGA